MNGTRLVRRPLSEEDRHGEFLAEVLPQRRDLHAIAMRYARQPMDAEDLVQEALLKAYAALDQFEPGSNLRAWLRRILVNTHHTRYAQRQRRPQEVPIDEETRPYDHRLELGSAAAAEEEALANHADPRLRTALAAISPKYREAVLLVDARDLTYAEAADMMDVPVGTVMSRVHRGRRQLRESLARAGWPSDAARRRAVTPAADAA